MVTKLRSCCISSAAPQTYNSYQENYYTVYKKKNYQSIFNPHLSFFISLLYSYLPYFRTMFGDQNFKNNTVLGLTLSLLFLLEMQRQQIQALHVVPLPSPARSLPVHAKRIFLQLHSIYKRSTFQNLRTIILARLPYPIFPIPPFQTILHVSF